MNFKLSILSTMLGSSFLALSNTCWADITFANGDFNLSGDMVIDASRGVTLGTNLLHSFTTFNIFDGESATFTGPEKINNIIARINGGSPSQINGLVRSNIVSANLFLINPNGLMFGPGAQFEVDGGLFISTANRVIFDDGSQLLVSDTGNSGFSISAPSAFGFDVSPADISFNKVLIETPVLSTGQYAAAPVDKLTIIGGDILFDDARIFLSNTDIDIVSLAAKAQVGLHDTRQLIDSALGDVLLKGSLDNLNVNLETSGDLAGNISILAKNLSLQSQAFIFSDSIGAGSGKGIDIILSSTLSLDGNSRITTDVIGEGNGGDINVQAQLIDLRGRFTIISSDNRSNTAKGGVVSISAENLSISESAHISSNTIGSGDAGSIIIDTQNLLIVSAGAVDTQSSGAGNGGDIQISATRDIIISGVSSGISSSADPFSRGDAGDIIINAARVSLADKAIILAQSQGFFSGAPGAIVINAELVNVEGLATISSDNSSDLADSGSILINAKSVSISGKDEFSTSNISSSTRGFSAGGDVMITADTISVAAGGSIEVVAFDAGAAGSISLVGDVSIDAGRVDARTQGGGDGGSISVSGIISIENGGRIDTSSPNDFDGVGNAGQINLSGTSLMIAGEGSAISSQTKGPGNAGKVAISSVNVLISEGALIDTSTLSRKKNAGLAGSLIFTNENLIVEGPASAISSLSSGPGRGGDILIQADTVSVIKAGSINVRATGLGNAGNINLSISDKLDILDGANILSNADISGGGNINVDVISRIYLRDSNLTASSLGSASGDDGGSINIDPIFLILDNSNIVAQAVQGNGGIINLVADNFISDVTSLISASSELGNDGEVTITSPDSSVVGVIGTLDTNLREEQVLLEKPCAVRVLADRSSLLVLRPVISSQAPGDYDAHKITSCNH